MVLLSSDRSAKFICRVFVFTQLWRGRLSRQIDMNETERCRFEDLWWNKIIFTRYMQSFSSEEIRLVYVDYTSTTTWSLFSFPAHLAFRWDLCWVFRRKKQIFSAIWQDLAFYDYDNCVFTMKPSLRSQNNLETL